MFKNLKKNLPIFLMILFIGVIQPIIVLADTVTWSANTGAGTAGSRSWSSVASSYDGTKLVAVTAGGSSVIATSTDSGATWSVQADPSGFGLLSVTSSSDGTKLAVGSNGGSIYTSINSGTTWVEQTGAATGEGWRSIASNGDGTRLAAIASGFVWTGISTDNGVSWTWTQNTDLGSIAIDNITSSADGNKLAASGWNGSIWTGISTDNGVSWTWTEETTPGIANWYSISSSADGLKLAVVAYAGSIWTATKSGEVWTWVERTSAGTRNWQAMTSSFNGSKLAAAAPGGYIYTSSDSGVTWSTNSDSSGINTWVGLASSSNGANLVAIDSGGYIYTGIVESGTPPAEPVPEFSTVMYLMTIGIAGWFMYSKRDVLGVK